jgi:uncharacterized integral membrane protein
MNASPSSPEPIYRGQFGSFTITDHDRTEVRLYRLGLTLAALGVMGAVGLVYLSPPLPILWPTIDGLFALFCLGLGLSLWTIHIYLRPLHRVLQGFWGLGVMSAIVLRLGQPQPLAQLAWEHPLSLLGLGLSFVALTGIFFKEAFCFNRWETKILTPLVPAILGGHFLGVLPGNWGLPALMVWAGFMGLFVVRKWLQPIADDIGDKSVFEYLKQQQSLGGPL